MTLLHLSKDFVSVAHSTCCYALLGILINAETRIKGIQIGDHEIKIVNLADDTIISLRDFSYPTKIELILKLYGKVASSKVTFQKSRPFIKIELINQDK